MTPRDYSSEKEVLFVGGSRGPTLAGLEWLSFSKLFSSVQKEGAKVLEKRDSFK